MSARLGWLGIIWNRYLIHTVKGQRSKQVTRSHGFWKRLWKLNLAVHNRQQGIYNMSCHVHVTSHVHVYLTLTLACHFVSDMARSRKIDFWQCGMTGCGREPRPRVPEAAWSAGQAASNTWSSAGLEARPNLATWHLVTTTHNHFQHGWVRLQFATRPIHRVLTVW